MEKQLVVFEWFPPVLHANRASALQERSLVEPFVDGDKIAGEIANALPLPLLRKLRNLIHTTPRPVLEVLFNQEAGS